MPFLWLITVHHSKTEPIEEPVARTGALIEAVMKMLFARHGACTT
jgi:hypothetical protein